MHDPAVPPAAHRLVRQDLGGRKPGEIDVFADFRPARGHEDWNRGGGGIGTLAEFVDALGRHIDRTLRFDGPQPGPRVEWRYQARSSMRKDPANGVDDHAEDRNPDVVLPNVAAQTGLTFTKRKRAVQVLAVTAAR